MELTQLNTNQMKSMKYLFSIFLFQFFITSILAQTDFQVEQSLLKFNIINPGFDYEFASDEDATINLGFGLQPFLQNDVFAFFPAVNLQYRTYINFDRRLKKQKKISDNTGNYVALSTALIFEKVLLGNLDSGSDIFGFAGPVYGIQRTSSDGFNFNTEFGLGYFFEGTNYGFWNGGNFGPIISMSVGWVLRKKN
jgi:hypothetical protein